VQPKRDTYNQLAEMMVEDILATSDKDLFAEITEDYGDGNALSVEFDRIAAPIIEKRAVAERQMAGASRSNVYAQADSASRQATGQAWMSLGRQLETFLRRVFGGVSLFPGTFGLATASLAAVVLVASAGFLLVKQFSSSDIMEQTASSTSPSRQQPSLAPPSSDDARTSAQAYFAEVATGRSENEAQANYRSLQGRFPSLLGARDPIIRLAPTAGDNDNSRYVALVGPFASIELARGFCEEFKASGAQCMTGQYPRSMRQ
jgi:hypothetical protein